VKTSALRRWLVSLGLIARDQTTRFTGGYDLIMILFFNDAE
jgi:response regulator